MSVRGPNPWLVAWLRTRTAAPVRKRCLVAGCGAGFDAEALASAGFDVTAADVAAANIAACQQRFPRSGVEYLVADVLAPPSDWLGAFDFVFDASLLDAVPPEARDDAMRAIARLIAPGGRALVICRARGGGGSIDAPPRQELAAFEDAGMRVNQFDVEVGSEGVRHIVAFFEQPLP